MILLTLLVACGSSDPSPDPDTNLDAASNGDGTTAVNCDPAAQTGCTVGDACYSDWIVVGGDPSYFCASPGSGGQGAACTADTDCAAGFWCLEYRDPNGVLIQQCSEYCRLPEHPCTAPFRCIAGPDTPPFGFCI